MEFISTLIPGVMLITPKVMSDIRGYFLESFRKDLFTQNVDQVDFIQENDSKSTYGVLRGLHYQVPPWAQNKLVRVMLGRVLDVVVDLRKSSPTFGQQITRELSEDNKHQLFIPKGCAHGFIVLSREAVFSYKVDAFYAPEFERGIFYADPDLNIDWGIPSQKIILSSKDQKLPYLKQAEIFE